MGLVAAGLALIIARIALGKSNKWLLTANLLTLSATLYACCFINFAALIARYNVDHSLEMSGQGISLDVWYLRALGPGRLPGDRPLSSRAATIVATRHSPRSPAGAPATRTGTAATGRTGAPGRFATGGCCAISARYRRSATPARDRSVACQRQQAHHMPHHILVADDDPHIREVIAFALEKAGMVDRRPSPTARPRCAPSSGRTPDLVVLDVGMPEMDGLEVCRLIRRTSDVPILFLSARDEEIDRILGLEMGGDDYVTKPFSPRELVARVNVILRRARAAPVDDGACGSRSRMAGCRSIRQPRGRASANGSSA